MNKKLNQIIALIREDIGLLLSISFGVFLFVLFFQPFPLDMFDFNNRLIFVAGMAGIVLFFMGLIRIIFHGILPLYEREDEESLFSEYMGGFLILALSSVAFAFYLRYVGQVSITFHVMFKVVLICLTPPVVLKLYDGFRKIKLRNEALVEEKRIIQGQVEHYEESYLNQTIEFVSETGSENLKLPVAEVAFIRSADNYIEIIYKNGDEFKKKLLRNTLKNVENQLRPYSNFIRCHRICIVNTHHIEKLNRDFSSYWLTIKGYNEKIPVSRQHILQFKERFSGPGGE